MSKEKTPRSRSPPRQSAKETKKKDAPAGGAEEPRAGDVPWSFVYINSCMLFAGIVGFSFCVVNCIADLNAGYDIGEVWGYVILSLFFGYCIAESGRTSFGKLDLPRAYSIVRDEIAAYRKGDKAQ